MMIRKGLLPALFVVSSAVLPTCGVTTVHASSTCSDRERHCEQHRHDEHNRDNRHHGDNGHDRQCHSVVSFCGNLFDLRHQP